MEVDKLMNVMNVDPAPSNISNELKVQDLFNLFIPPD